MNKAFLAGVVCVCTSALNPALAEDSIDISDSWVRAAPPGASIMAGYLELSNHSHTAITLTGASSPQFESVEIHMSYNESGMMRMKQVTPMTIKSHESIRFEPGSYHLMLIKPIKALKLGDSSQVTLEFKNHPATTIEMPVKKFQASEATHEMGHGHGHH